MNDQDKMRHEMARVRSLMDEAIQGVEAEDGDVRFFTASILTAAVQLCVEVEGIDGLHRAISKIAQREFIRAGEAGRC